MRFRAVEHQVAFAAFVLAVAIFAYSHQAFAAVAGGLSLGVGEEYNDNIFFSNEKNHKNESDFITHIVPTFTFSYAPFGATAPTLNASLSTSGEIYANHSDLNNFGKNIEGNIGYTYRATPRLNLHFADNFSREGTTRTIGLEAFAPPVQLPATPTQVAPVGSFITMPTFQDAGGLLTKGSNIANYAYLGASYLYAPNLTFSGAYGNSYSNTGGVGEVWNNVGFRGVYNWRRDHNLYAGYTVSIITSNAHGRKGGNSQGNDIIHNIDIGDDYFSGFKIQLDPTWTISASGGIGINTSGNGPGLGGNSNLTMIKVWEKATLNLAVRRGFTGSYGISTGPSLTTTISSGFGARLTQDLAAYLGTEYSIFETNDGDFKVFRAAAGVQYWVTRWLSSQFWYAYRFRDAGNNSNNTAIASSGRVSGNAVVLTAAVYFDTYPNFRLSRGGARSLYPQMGAPLYMGSESQQPSRPGPAPAPSPSIQ